MPGVTAGERLAGPQARDRLRGQHLAATVDRGGEVGVHQVPQLPPLGHRDHRLLLVRIGVGQHDVQPTRQPGLRGRRHAAGEQPKRSGVGAPVRRSWPQSPRTR